MPRPRQSGRKIGNSSEESIKQGVILIRNGMSMRKASKTVGVPFATLKRYFWKTKNAESLDGQRLQPNYGVRKIFTAEQEVTLKDYINHCALLFYGLTSKECRQIAFQCAIINNLKIPSSWETHQMAGKDWLLAFKRRHNLSTRRPEPCSLSRATSFNQNNVAKFFENLENLIKRDPAFADGTRIFNLDETSTTTVQRPQKVVAPKGKKCIGKVTSGERGTLVTTCCIIGASGIALPPVMVFPRKHFKEHMIKNTPPGTLGLATPTGWMNSTIFPEVMKHFIKHTNASKENPCILIMDNHESHLCLEALNMAKDAGVHILTLHPHTSGKLQPLDVGVYGPFKVYYNAAIDSWLMRHPGKTITIYDLGEIIGIAFQKVMTPLNITKSFAKCGIYPFDKLIFTEEDFLPSSVTDQPCPDCAPREVGISENCPLQLFPRTGIIPEICPRSSSSNMTYSNEIPGISSPKTQSTVQSTMDISTEIDTTNIENQMHATEISTNISKTLLSSSSLREHTPATVSADAHFVGSSDLNRVDLAIRPITLQNQATQAVLRLLSETEAPTSVESATIPSPSLPFISPFAFMNPIKAMPRKADRKRRKAGRSMIVTDTPEKLLIEQEKNAIKQKKAAKKKTTVRKVLQSDDEEEDIDEELKLPDSDEYSDEADSDRDNEEQEIVILTEKKLARPLPRPPSEGEYVVVQFVTKKQKSLFVGKVLEGRNTDLEYYVSFLRRKPSTERFHMPENPDLSVIKENDIKYILPKPSVVGTLSRPFYTFPIDLSSLKLR